MNDRQRYDEFLKVMLELEQLSFAIYDAVKHQADGWRLRVVGLRRELGDRVGVAVTTLDDWTPSAPAVASLLPKLREEMAELRTALAEHQASWPAVSLDPSAPGYRESLAKLMTAQTRVRATMEHIDALLNAG